MNSISIFFWTNPSMSSMGICSSFKGVGASYSSSFTSSCLDFSNWDGSFDLLYWSVLLLRSFKSISSELLLSSSTVGLLWLTVFCFCADLDSFNLSTNLSAFGDTPNVVSINRSFSEIGVSDSTVLLGFYYLSSITSLNESCSDSFLIT